MHVVHTAFTEEYGFRFTNSFDLSLGLGHTTYGLCGGFCFAALDYYYAGRPIPAQTASPAAGSPLFRYLLRRQADSLSRPSVLPRLALWMAASDARTATWTVRVELPRILSMLDGGEPAVLLVMRTGGLADPTHNHQVVATGYGRADDGALALSLYDPNHPGEEPMIVVLAEGGQVTLSQTSGEAVRGFFGLSYRASSLPLPI